MRSPREEDCRWTNDSPFLSNDQTESLQQSSILRQGSWIGCLSKSGPDDLVGVRDEGSDHLGASTRSYDSHPFGKLRAGRLTGVRLGRDLFQSLSKCK